METLDIGRILAFHQLGSVIEIIPVITPPTIGAGGAGQTTHIRTGKGDFFVKFGKPGILASRTAYYEVVEPYLTLPRLRAKGDGYQILDWIPNGESLLGFVLRGDIAAIEWFQRACLLLKDLWSVVPPLQFTAHVSGHYGKNRKAEDGLMNYLDGAEHLYLVVNGRAVKLTLRMLWDRVMREIAQPVITPRMTHGDPRLDNILVHPNGLTFIDVRPGFSDWIDDLALFAWQRGFRIVEFSTTPSVRRTAKNLVIDHTTRWPSFVDEAESYALEMAEQFAKDRGDNAWHHRYCMTVAACALREIVSIQRRRKIGALGRELPDGAEYFWVTEAIKYYLLASSASTAKELG